MCKPCCSILQFKTKQKQALGPTPAQLLSFALFLHKHPEHDLHLTLYLPPLICSNPPLCLSVPTSSWNHSHQFTTEQHVGNSRYIYPLHLLQETFSGVMVLLLLRLSSLLLSLLLLFFLLSII